MALRRPASTVILPRRAAAVAALIAAFGCGELPPPPRTDRATELAQAIQAWAARPGHQGVSASVVFSDGSQWSATAGTIGGGERLREEHLVWIASITKTMTGAIILQLAGEGAVSLDDPVSRWLPSRPSVDPAITMRQLLNHTNGLDNYTLSAALGDAIDADPARVFTPDELLSFLGPPHFAPGARTEYTNTSFLLLGQVAEAVTGRTILDLYHQRLWGPLSLAPSLLDIATRP